MIHYSSLVWLLPHLRLKLKFAIKWPKTKAVAICPFYYLVMGFSTFLFQSTASSKVTQLRDVRFNAACCSVIETLYFVYWGHIYSLLASCSSLFSRSTNYNIQPPIYNNNQTFFKNGRCCHAKVSGQNSKKLWQSLSFLQVVLKGPGSTGSIQFGICNKVLSPIDCRDLMSCYTGNQLRNSLYSRVAPSE